MSGEFLVTLGDVSGIKDILSGASLQGRREPRVAMVGRSNVGKSSLINALVGTRLAQVSNQPGKTRAIHFYVWHDARKIIADLPGYGYAKTSHSERERWGRFIEGYFKADAHLELALVLLDSRHGPTDLDREAIQFLSLQGIPLRFIFTKADTLKTQGERVARRREAEGALREMGFDPSEAVWVSSRTKDGMRSLSKELGARG